MPFYARTIAALNNQPTTRQAEIHRTKSPIIMRDYSSAAASIGDCLAARIALALEVV